MNRNKNPVEEGVDPRGEEGLWYHSSRQKQSSDYCDRFFFFFF